MKALKADTLKRSGESPGLLLICKSRATCRSINKFYCEKSGSYIIALFFVSKQRNKPEEKITLSKRATCLSSKEG